MLFAVCTSNCLLFPASSCELLLYAKYPYSSVQSSTVCFFRLHRDTTAIYNNTRSHILCICLPGLCCIAMQPEDDIHTIRSIYDMHINMYNNNNVCIKYVCAYFHIYTHFEASSSRKVVKTKQKNRSLHGTKKQAPCMMRTFLSPPPPPFSLRALMRAGGGGRVTYEYHTINIIKHHDIITTNITFFFFSTYDMYKVKVQMPCGYIYFLPPFGVTFRSFFLREKSVGNKKK